MAMTTWLNQAQRMHVWAASQVAARAREGEAADRPCAIPVSGAKSGARACHHTGRDDVEESVSCVVSTQCFLSFSRWEWVVRATWEGRASAEPSLLTRGTDVTRGIKM